MMKVDMSPEAVSMRLDTMGELWELSVALMDSTRSGVASSSTAPDAASKLPWKSLFAITGLGTSILGCLLAYSVTSEPIAYIASMSHGIIFLFLLCPVSFVLFCLVIAAAALQKLKLAILFSTALILFPLSYFAFLGIAQALGMAPHNDDEVNRMRPIGWDVKERIVIVFKREATQDQIHSFDENVLRKKIPQPNGVLLEFADGVCNFSYPQAIPKRTAVDIPFCKDATEEQKSKIRTEVISSPLIEIAFEDTESGEVKKLK